MIRNDEFIENCLGGDDSVWNKLRYDRDGIIEASAGTGKTYALQRIVLKLVAEREHPVGVKNILLVTFTEKAAGELKDRIRDILTEAGLLPSDFDETTICTIHSFCREILSEYAFENRVPMQMEIGGANGDLIHRAVRAALLSNDFRARYGDVFDAYMKAAGLNTADDLAVAAEAMLKECAQRDQPPSAPQRLDDAMRSKLSSIAAKTSLDFAGITVNARAMQGFEYACSAIGAEIGNLASEDLPTFIKSVNACAANCGKMNPSVNGRGRGVRLFDIRADIKEFAEVLAEVQNVLSAQLAADLAFLAWPQFTHLKDEAAMLTFDDLVTKAYRVIRHEAEREADGAHSALMDSIRSRYRIALVDEFQDTNEKQWTIFRSLFSSRVNRIDGDGAPNPRQGFLLVVGDPKQAIYSFQGADVATYLAAKGEITGGEVAQEMQSLDKTFRSCRPLVDSFQKMFGEASGWFSDMKEGDERIAYPEVGYPEGNERFLGLEDLTGRDAVTLLESLPKQLPGELKGQRSGYGNSTMCLPVFMRNAAREMKRLCALNVAYRTTDPETERPIGHKIRYGDMCVLVRGGAEAKVVKRVLAEEGIPYSHYKERGIYGSVEAEALIALFDFLAEPGRSGNLAALLITPLFNVHPSELEAWLASGDKALADLVERWQELSAKRSWIALFESVMNDTALPHPAQGDYEYDRRWTACRQILDRLLAEKGHSALVPGEFAALLRSWRKDDLRSGENGALRQKENESDSVQIMTMHASKGLEFKAVFIASGFSGLKDGEDADERKRLYYVALTRAEHKLYLPWTQWDSHTRNVQKQSVEERGLGSVGSPLLGDGFLSRAIRACFERPVVLNGHDASSPSDDSPTNGQDGRSPSDVAIPKIYEVGYLRNLRLKWDSFSSLCHSDGTGKIVPSVENETDESSAGGLAAQKPVATLLPRNNVSGNVFHEIMETLCGGNELIGALGFAVGEKTLAEALEETGPLMELVRRTMRRNALGNQKRGDDSTERTLVRMVWRALNTRIEIGERAIFLKDIPFADRLAEVEFVMDEASVLGEDVPHAADAVRDGAFNGKIDLLIRPDGKDGAVYVLDWKTNSLVDYGRASVEAGMEAAGYPLQFQLYSLAVARWLGREKLAGVAYLFVRGGEHGEASGVYSRVMDDTMFANCRQRVMDAVSHGR